MAEKGILDGIRVIEAATYIFGPAAATVMSDFGAEVIKVERPGTGDPYRYLSYIRPMPVSEVNYCWLLDGRNKKSIALNLARESGRQVLIKLIETADVFITNYQPSVLDKLKLNYEDIKPINERLIYAHATGYGEEGDEIEKPGFDMTALWARSGLMDAVYDAEGQPALSVAGMGDHPSAMTLFGGILLALYQRERTGRGAKVSNSLMANGAWANSCLLQAALCQATPYTRGTRASAFNPMVNHYTSRDGKRFIFCLIQAEKDWPALCRATGRAELIDDARFATGEARVENAAALIKIFDRALAEKDMEEWEAIFAEYELAWSPVSSIEEVARDRQMEANRMFIEMDHPQHGKIKTINSPVFISDAEKVAPRPAPEVGEHTHEILRELGYSEQLIEELLDSKAVG
ncbi:MAG TPA: CoA transferase [Blastocatellia bacterium]|jgi:formyl-CoA transferase